MDSIFLFRQKIDDKDACAYIDRASIEDYYINIPNPYGPRYFRDWNINDNYGNIETYLTKIEYAHLRKLIDRLNIIDLFNDYDKAKFLVNKLNTFINLTCFSTKAKKFKEKIQDSECKYLIDNYNLDKKDMRKIFANTKFIDRNVVKNVYNSSYQLAKEFIKEQYNSLDNFNDDFDFERYGNSLLTDNKYIILNYGRIIELY